MSEEYLFKSQFPSSFTTGHKRGSQLTYEFIQKKQKLLSGESVEQVTQNITKTHPFKFLTETRGRTPKYISHEQRELEYIKTAHKFKAKPSPFISNKENVRPHICQLNHQIPEIPVKPKDFSQKPLTLTEPKSPQLETTFRGYLKKAQFNQLLEEKKRLEEEIKPFKAQPMPKFPMPRSITPFSTRNRPVSERSQDNSIYSRSASSESLRGFKAKAMPDFSAPFVPLKERKTTKFSEFSLSCYRKTPNNSGNNYNFTNDNESNIEEFQICSMGEVNFEEGRSYNANCMEENIIELQKPEFESNEFSEDHLVIGQSSTNERLEQNYNIQEVECYDIEMGG